MLDESSPTPPENGTTEILNERQLRLATIDSYQTLTRAEREHIAVVCNAIAESESLLAKARAVLERL